MRIDTVLIGMDFSETAIAAAQWVTTELAPAAWATLVHAVEPAPRPRFAVNVLPAAETIETYATDFATRRLHEVRSFLTSELSPAVVRVGTADTVLGDVARETDADLIVIGPHGDRPRTHKFLGTTAERIVHHAPVPVVVATNPPRHAPRRILVPIDDAAITSSVIAWAHDLGAAFDAQVTLLHVWSNAVYSHVASMCYAAHRDEHEAKQEIQRELDGAAMHWLNALARTGLPPDRVDSRVTYGNPGDESLRIADELQADLIVVGRHGAGLARPRLLGTTVNTILHGAHCPVLVVVAPEE